MSVRRDCPVIVSRLGVRPMGPFSETPPSTRVMSPRSLRSGKSTMFPSISGRPKPLSETSEKRTVAGSSKTASSAPARVSRDCAQKMLDSGRPRASIPRSSVMCDPAMRIRARPVVSRSRMKACPSTPSIPRGSTSARAGTNRPPRTSVQYASIRASAASRCAP